MKQILTSEAFKAFNYSSIIDEVVFCLGEKQGMLINHECSSWYNGVGDFDMSAWDRKKETTSLLSVRSMAQNAMTVCV